jgi:hypothetical protein
LTYDESMQWLDERGGVWSVRATGSRCAVTARLGANAIEVDAGGLSQDRVYEALVDAIQSIQTLCGGRPQGGCP